MLARVKAAEAESLRTTGQTLAQRRQRSVEDGLAAFRRLSVHLAAVGVTINEQSHEPTRGTTEFLRALPVFVAELDGDYPENIKAFMLRKLACREAAPFRSTLVDALRSTEESSDYLRFLLAAAIDAMSGPEHLMENISLARDRTLGSSRLAFLRTFARSRSPAATLALEELKTDPDLHREIAAIFVGKTKYKLKKAQGDA